MLLQPTKKTMKKLREVLNELYKHLDSSAAGIIDVSRPAFVYYIDILFHIFMCVCISWLCFIVRLLCTVKLFEYRFGQEQQLAEEGVFPIRTPFLLIGIQRRCMWEIFNKTCVCYRFPWIWGTVAVYWVAEIMFSIMLKCSPRSLVNDITGRVFRSRRWTFPALTWASRSTTPTFTTRLTATYWTSNCNTVHVM